LCQQRPQPGAVGHRGGQQFVVAVEQVGHAALGDRHLLRTQRLVDLRHAAMLVMTQPPGQRHHVQPELMLRQGNRTFRLRPVGAVVA